MNQRIEIRRYGNRNWAVYINGELLAVTVYKKGALAVAMMAGEFLEGANRTDEEGPEESVEASEWAA